MSINFGTDSPLAVQNLPSSFAPSGVPIGWYNARRKLLVKLATSYLGDANSAVAVMSSQGVADTSDPNVQKTREGFNELRVRLPVLNQYYNYTASHGGIPDTEALAKVKSIVLAWASINQPTGKPIDETNFENLLRVIGNRWGNFSSGEQATITTWLNALKTAKESWSFNPATGEGKLQYGNHYTHHYKILLRVYQLLGLTTAYNTLVSSVTTFATQNFPFATGPSQSPQNSPSRGSIKGPKRSPLRAIKRRLFSQRGWIKCTCNLAPMRDGIPLSVLHSPAAPQRLWCPNPCPVPRCPVPCLGPITTAPMIWRERLNPPEKAST
jgi:hypothetical protein